mmetsp:Transcript_19759/g.59616  ORF Transcript_19759/g.59616 Transcript_19759/m.59616 type:complete len:515 (-) Transcript_19759:29-1573(-)
MLLHMPLHVRLSIEIQFLEPPVHHPRSEAEDVALGRLHGHDVPEPDRHHHPHSQDGKQRLQPQVAAVPRHACHRHVEALLPDEADEDARARHELPADHILVLHHVLSPELPGVERFQDLFLLCLPLNRLRLPRVSLVVQSVDQHAAAERGDYGQHDAQLQLLPLEEGRQEPLHAVHEAPGEAEAGRVHQHFEDPRQYPRRLGLEEHPQLAREAVPQDEVPAFAGKAFPDLQFLLLPSFVLLFLFSFFLALSFFRRLFLRELRQPPAHDLVLQTEDAHRGEEEAHGDQQHDRGLHASVLENQLTLLAFLVWQVAPHKEADGGDTQKGHEEPEEVVLTVLHLLLRQLQKLVWLLAIDQLDETQPVDEAEGHRAGVEDAPASQADQHDEGAVPEGRQGDQQGTPPGAVLVPVGVHPHAPAGEACKPRGVGQEEAALHAGLRLLEAGALKILAVDNRLHALLLKHGLAPRLPLGEASAPDEDGHAEQGVPEHCVDPIHGDLVAQSKCSQLVSDSPHMV